MPKEARQIYKTNELPFLLRLVAPFNKRIGLPYNITAYTSAHAAKLVLLIPALAVFGAANALFTGRLRLERAAAPRSIGTGN